MIKHLALFSAISFSGLLQSAEESIYHLNIRLNIRVLEQQIATNTKNLSAYTNQHQRAIQKIEFYEDEYNDITQDLAELPNYIWAMQNMTRRLRTLIDQDVQKGTRHAQPSDDKRLLRVGNLKLIEYENQYKQYPEKLKQYEEKIKTIDEEIYRLEFNILTLESAIRTAQEKIADYVSPITTTRSDFNPSLREK